MLAASTALLALLLALPGCSCGGLNATALTDDASVLLWGPGWSRNPTTGSRTSGIWASWRSGSQHQSARSQLVSTPLVVAALWLRRDYVLDSFSVDLQQRLIDDANHRQGGARLEDV